jgi:lysophospholipid acyltransferase (LPLAT)-like uncharacterized protein
MRAAGRDSVSQEAALDWRARGAVIGGTAVLRMLAATWRVRRIVHDREVIPGLGDRRPRIYAFWHSQMLPALASHRNSGIAVLISEHRDGELIAQVAARFGVLAIRGSTSRGAAGALRAMERALADGVSVAVTPDGPRGPAEVFAPGTLIAAQRSSVPIVLGAVLPTRAWRLKSWDRFIIPKPFAELVVAYSEEITIAALTPRAAAGAAAEFQTRLRALNETAHAG